MEDIADFYECLVETGGCGFIVNYGTTPLISLGVPGFQDVIFVNAVDPVSAVGMTYEVSKSGYLPSILTVSDKLDRIVILLEEIRFPLVLLVKQDILWDFDGFNLPYCKLDSVCTNVAKVAGTAVSTKGPVALFMD